MPETVRRPHYARPPVIEVVCGVQYEGLDGWGTPHYGKFWSRIEKDYPQFEEHPPLPRVRLASQSANEPQFSALPPLRRVFFIQPPGNFLIQLQQNRFLHNWRKMRDEDAYPRFDTAYERFVRLWNDFKGYLVDAGFPEPQSDAFELTYINHIMAEGATFPRDVWEFLDFYQQNPEATTPRKASAFMIQFAWPLPDDRGVLTLDVKHGHRMTDQKEVVLMELSAKGRAQGGEPEMTAWFDVAHNAIVNTFDKLTTEKAHIIWGKM